MRSAKAELSSQKVMYANKDDETVKKLVRAQEVQNKKQLEQLVEDIFRACGKDNSKSIEVVLYVDEAHSLHTPTRTKNDKSLYTIFCSCTADLSTLPFFVIFLSTTSSLVHFAPVAELVRSARVKQKQTKLQASITETPFDSFFNGQPSEDGNSFMGPIRPGSLTYYDVSEVEFMARFGRPLYVVLTSDE